MLATRLKKLEAAIGPRNAEQNISLYDLTPWMLDAPADDYIHGAWSRFLLIQPWAVDLLVAQGMTRGEAIQLTQRIRSCVADSMAVNMALKRVPDEVYLRYERAYQDAELYRQIHHPRETLADEN